MRVMLSNPDVGTRYQPGQRGHGWHEGRAGKLR